MFKPVSLKAIALGTAAVLSAGTIMTAAPALADHHKAAAKAQSNIVQAAMGTGMHNTLVAAVKAAGLVDTLSSPGPFTIFAPTDTAFAKLPEGTVGTLVKPENKTALTNILTYHAVAGEVKAADLIALINSSGGTATLTTVAGGTLSARLSGDTVVITDAAGRASAVTTTDVDVSNGVIHVTDGVFLPG
ncbi:fasciclin domain-containing protein [Allopontixanthobacter sp.]|uniref:fasciclin domain-containing protein n=1 Tax=Allopontixanthobacter sp. TaxID=2906452 RepID=UPI002AB9FC0E|nr:fasciclin domain-containing protein [Allopontixanthobacter sp.]MDZ4306852.1 fasciclin domain-containing protein [Allopontixanthobacter sp.]